MPSTARHTCCFKRLTRFNPWLFAPTAFLGLLGITTHSLASTVTGRVTTPGGAPVPNVAIRVEQIGGELPPWNILTGPDGRYSISDPLLFGNLDVFAGRNGVVVLPFRQSFFDPGFSTITADFIAHDRSPVFETTATFNRLGLSLVAEGNALGLPTDAFFEFGVPPAFDHRTAAFPLTGTNRTTVTVSAPTPTTGATKLQARLILTNALGRSEGPTTGIVLPQFIPVFNLEDPQLSSLQGLAAADVDRDGFMDLQWLVRSRSSDSPLISGVGPMQWAPRSPCATCPAAIRFGGLGGGAWLDWNHDNAPDLFLMEESSGGQLLLSTPAGLTRSGGLRRPTSGIRQVAISDFNVDGIPDLLATGRLGTTLSHFGTISGSELATIGQGDVSAMVAGDFNQDGWPDLVYAAFKSPDSLALYLVPGTGSISFRELNDEEHLFEYPSGIDRYSSLAISDIDGDGLLDIIAASRLKADQLQLQILWNDTSTSFGHRFTASFPIVSGDSQPSPILASGDFDGDGIADVLLPYDPPRILSTPGRVVSTRPMPELGPETIALIPFDADSDGRLDLAVVGPSEGDRPQILRNQSGPINRPPTSPIRLRAGIQVDRVAFRWEPGPKDDLTPTPSLTWNLRVGTTPGGSELLSPLADLTTGRRYVLQPGNAGHNRFLNLAVDPSVTRIFWSVQAVDAGYLGGQWAPERTLSLDASSTLTLTQLEFDTHGAVRVLASGNWTDAILHRSTDLDEWEPLTPFRLNGGFLEAIDPAPPSASELYYMAR